MHWAELNWREFVRSSEFIWAIIVHFFSLPISSAFCLWCTVHIMLLTFTEQIYLLHIGFSCWHRATLYGSFLVNIIIIIFFFTQNFSRNFQRINWLLTILNHKNINLYITSTNAKYIQIDFLIFFHTQFVVDFSIYYWIFIETKCISRADFEFIVGFLHGFLWWKVYVYQ